MDVTYLITRKNLQNTSGRPSEGGLGVNGNRKKAYYAWIPVFDAKVKKVQRRPLREIIMELALAPIWRRGTLPGWVDREMYSQRHAREEKTPGQSFLGGIMSTGGQ